MKRHRVALHWFRRDLRLTDNPALHSAAQSSDQVVPVYILSNWKGAHSWTGAKRQAFLCGCLDSLNRNLQSIGSRLLLRSGRADHEIEKLIVETGAEAVYFNRDYDPYGREMESRVRQVCTRLNVCFQDCKDRVLHEPDEVLTLGGSSYRVFTPYWRNWVSLAKPSPHGRVTTLGPASTCSSLNIPSQTHWNLSGKTVHIIPAGERAARKRMSDFLSGNGLTSYDQRRDIPAGQTTSQLSQDLRFGLLSVRELYARCQTQASTVNRKAVDTFIKELAWREFYMAVLHHHPEVLDMEFNPEFRGLNWEGTPEHFSAWCEGKTGFPIVDAGMRQLLTTGFMHNRVRMIVAMFLTKDLHCDWRWGESFFMQHLVDGEIASNNGGWQWSAGTGADAAPYFRIQNPWTQSRRYDLDGTYIKTWLPELAQVDALHLHQPPKDGHPLAPDYPLPIVDHAAERSRTLAMYAQHRTRHR